MATITCTIVRLAVAAKRAPLRCRAAHACVVEARTSGNDDQHEEGLDEWADFDYLGQPRAEEQAEERRQQHHLGNQEQRGHGQELVAAAPGNAGEHDQVVDAWCE
ncbi:hypothetical protein [Pseudonocardia ailaonensis]|uniref:hypothetical protein n=1 Tax=Pseudonocardia ailaonensis TaxID=367279 RepID=UPI0031DC0E60